MLVYDRTVLDYLINARQLEDDINLLPVSFNKQYQSLFMQNDSDLMKKVNPEIISIISDNKWERVLNKYNLRIK